MPAYLIVKANVVAEDDIAKFDHWYQNEHLPDAVKAFKAQAAWRGWSDVDKHVHYAFYEFPDLASVRAIGEGAKIKALIAEFDRTWGERVTRTRDVVESLQSLSG